MEVQKYTDKSMEVVYPHKQKRDLCSLSTKKVLESCNEEHLIRFLRGLKNTADLGRVSPEVLHRLCASL